ncbi:ATP-binding cassette domain-containing protein [Mycobacterium spongiae]|uniref:ATP-binding cassette domain-containing protein n=1 Tax=Mycobacterium spongiae TaxID=886343 RepID=A0A975JZB9_9MYCO|nr:ATP-binding cassette domain-containing protein [Mycobacterium spongiae]
MNPSGYRFIALLGGTSRAGLRAQNPPGAVCCKSYGARPGRIVEVTASGPLPAHRRGGPLRPGELAQAAVMAALCAVTAIISVVVPFAAGLALLGTVPMALLAYRYRLRALTAATIAAGMIAFLIAGLGGFMGVVHSAYIGGLTGVIKRKGRGTPTVVVAAVFAGLAFGALMVGMLAALTRLRHLIFKVMTANMDGLASFLARIHLESVGEDLKRYLADGLHYWPFIVLGHFTIGITVVSIFGWWALSRLLERMRGIPDVHKLDAAPGDDDAPIGPVPVRLDNVRFRYPGSSQDALREVSLDLHVGEHVAITGPNGSGKTTLMLLLAGREPTSGIVERPGAVGLGKLGGTAVVLQHPESQVLGTRVADDVVWGLPPGTKIDVGQLLSEVGLAGLAERDTGSLSGGELQRLALAAALAREPAMLIADEVTTMVDRQGREALLGVISGLTKRHRTALVHITHYNTEAESADRTIDLSDSPDNTTMVETTDVPVLSAGAEHGEQPPVLELVGVGHEYGRGTPWAKTALRDINVVIEQGDGVLIHGGNGSGKSTLAWIMAGLTIPTSGACLLDGRPTHEQVGAVALSFQAARLQLMRSRVDWEVASAAGFSPRDEDRVSAALGAVGLDPALAKRGIDQLSGGQMRRVVLAGLLACSPRALILDEPLAGLDAASQRGLMRMLEDLRRERGLTVVVISHDFTGMEGLCPRTLALRDGALEPVPTTAAGGRGV